MKKLIIIKFDFYIKDISNKKVDKRLSKQLWTDIICINNFKGSIRLLLLLEKLKNKLWLYYKFELLIFWKRDIALKFVNFM